MTKAFDHADTKKNSLAHPSFYEAFRFWLVLGFISFGGPAGQISIMHDELVERRKWISNARFLHALNFCMFLPGPEATQLSIYIGWLLHRTTGGIVAGLLFVLPSVVILWVLSYLYVEFGDIPWLAAIFYGLKPAVVAIVMAAVIRIGDKALKNKTMWAIAALAWIALFFFNVPFPLVILSAMMIDWIGGTFWKNTFFNLNDKVHSQDEGIAVIHDHLDAPLHTLPSFKRSLKVIFCGLLLWWVPLLIVGYFTGFDHVIFQEALFFSKAAMVTFGGAYAVLSYVAQHALENSWILPGQMIDGLGLAETTPGPLIMVLQFVGFLGGWHLPGGMRPLFSATLGALVTTWATFVPCFIWIFLGAPYIEKFRHHVRFRTALSAVTAAVVGVVLNLAIWFALQVLFRQQGGFDPVAALICFCNFLGIWKWKWEIISVVFGSGFLSLLYWFIPNII